MKTTTMVAVGCLLVMPLLAGCGTVPRGEVVQVTYLGSINASNGTFQMNGELSTGGGVPDREVYRNVTVQLYTNDGTRLCGVTVGDLTANHGQRNVSVEASTLPEFVVITSPDFWHGKMEANYFQREADKNGYERQPVYSREGLPVSVDDTKMEACSG